MKKIILRKGIAMIELIFAIVIMGIVLMSAPMLISTASNSAYVALQQEAIAAVASKTGMILTFHWDENNTDVNLTAPVLVTSGDTGLNEGTNIAGDPTRVRGGTPPNSKRTFPTSTSGGRLNATTAANLGPDGDIDDMDDFISGAVTALTDVNTTSASEGDYIDTAMQLTTTVAYVNDALTSGSYPGTGNSITFDFNTTTLSNSTNIKKVEVRLTTTQNELTKNIILKAFACNIGTFELEERNY